MALATVVVAAGVAVVGAGAARADGSRTFPFTGGVQTFTVPAGVFWVTIDAQGGHGGQFPNDHTAWGGRGGGVTATLATTPGTTYSVYVGGFGWFEGGWGYHGGGERGGASGSVIGYSGAGGGGDSAVVADDGDIMIVDAGGGGGAGGDKAEDDSDYGGPGGDGGHPPGDGHGTAHAQGGLGGGAGGAKGENGEDLGAGTGGAGGGGGGGFPTGGGGGHNGAGAGIASGSGGGGGGAGSSYIIAGALAARYYTSQRGCGWDYAGGCDGLVVISWGTTPHTVMPSAGSGQQRVIGNRFSALKVKVTNADGIPVGDRPVRFTLPADGASGSFPGGATAATVRTDRFGIAVAPQLTANASAGRWTAEASVAGVPTPARFALRNRPAPTTTAAASSASPAPSGEPVRIVARVAGHAGDPSLRPVGKVQFALDGDPVGDPVGLDSAGRATSPALTPPVGDHTVVAHYLGSPDYEPGSATVAQRVVKAPTSTALDSSLNPSGSGDDVAFSARVTVPAPGAGVPTGTVQFRVDGSDLGGPVPVDASGTATSPVTSTLAAGAHDVSATYSGDADLLPSGGTLVQSVGEEATATLVSTSVDPAVYGEPFTITAAVARRHPGTDVEGRVSFQLDGDELCSTTLEDDGASCPVSRPLEPGTHLVRVDYDAGPGYEDSHGTLTQQVVAARTRLDLTADPEPSPLGDAIVLRAALAVEPPGGGTPAGSVRFSVDGIPVGGPVALHDGEAASAPISALQFGPHVIEADYTSAATRYAASHGATIHLVAAATTTTALTSSADPASWGAPVTFTARVEGGSSTGVPGTVQFAVDGEPLGDAVPLEHGQAVSAPARGLAPGAHLVTAEYQGANGYGVSEGSLTQHVDLPAPSGRSAGARPGGPAAPRLVVASQRARVNARGTLKLRVACVGAPGRRCTGRLRLSTARRIHGRASAGGRRAASRRVSIAVRRASLSAGSARRLPVDLNRAGERIASSRAGLRAIVRLVGTRGTSGGSRRLRLRSARAPALAVVTRSPRVGASGQVALRVRCAAPRSGGCRGRLTLTATGRQLARRRLSAAGAATRVVRLDLPAWARARLARAGTLRARAVATSTIRVGRSRDLRRTIALRWR